jgi:hypothetical protein
MFRIRDRAPGVLNANNRFARLRSARIKSDQIGVETLTEISLRDIELPRANASGPRDHGERRGGGARGDRRRHERQGGEYGNGGGAGGGAHVRLPPRSTSRFRSPPEMTPRIMQFTFPKTAVAAGITTRCCCRRSCQATAETTFRRRLAVVERRADFPGTSNKLR